MFKKNDKIEENKVKHRKRFVLDDTTPFVITEAYKTARVNLIFALAPSDKKVVVFTSATPREGKTTTCVNMAITLSNTGSRVLIIDGDLRKPSIHKMLKLDNKAGLSNLLSDQTTIDKVCHVGVRENMDVITSGSIPPNPSELLSSSRMEQIMEQLGKKYDYICIDTPPVNIMSDALVLNNISSGIFFVVQENVTSHKDIQTALENVRMTNGKVLGFLKNACTGEYGMSKSKGYNYDYNYSYESEEAKLTQTT